MVDLTLPEKVRPIKEKVLSCLEISTRRTHYPLIVAMVGLTGSGKGIVARKLAELIGGAVVKSHQIHVSLRLAKESYAQALLIVANLALDILRGGGNVVFDSDHIAQEKRAIVREVARRANAKLAYIRVVTNPDIQIGRIITGTYEDASTDFFGGARTVWDSDMRGAVVKLREFWRRTPLHYEWNGGGGGKWRPRKTLRFPIFAEIDTSSNWEGKAEEVGRQLHEL